MKFQPYSREEAEKKRSTLMPEGRYNARIVTAEEKVSNSGNDMIELEVEVYGPEGKVIIRDWLLNTDRMAWKLQHFAEACKLEKKYERGELTADDCEGQSCAVEVTVETQKPTAKYPNPRPQNRITDYMAQEFAHVAPPSTGGKATTSEKIDDDDVPF